MVIGGRLVGFKLFQIDVCDKITPYFNMLYNLGCRYHYNKKNHKSLNIN